MNATNNSSNSNTATSSNANSNNANNVNEANSFSASSRHVEADTITALRSKMEKQRVELDLRTDNVNAIQRNFQRLSEMYAADRQRLSEFEKNARAMAIEIESLRAEQKLFRALQQEYTGVKSQLATQEELYTRSVRSKEAEILELREHIRQAAEKERHLQESLSRLQGSNEKDAIFKEKVMAAVLGCDKALSEAVGHVVEEERFLRAEVEQMMAMMTRKNTSTSETSNNGSSSNNQTCSFTDLLLLMQKSTSSSGTSSTSILSHAGTSTSSSSSNLVDSRINSHSSNLKHFSTILNQKLSSITRLAASAKREQQLQHQEANLRLSELDLENKKLKDDLHRVEEQSQLTRNVASEGSKVFAHEKAVLKRQLSEMHSQMIEIKLDALQQREVSERYQNIVAPSLLLIGATSDKNEDEDVTSSSSSSNLPCVAHANSLAVDFFSKRLQLVEKQWEQKYSAQVKLYEGQLFSRRSEIASLQSQLRDSMGDGASVASRLEQASKRFADELDCTKQNLAKTQQHLEDTRKQLHASQVDSSIVKAESIGRNQILQDFFGASVVFTKFLQPEKQSLLHFFSAKLSQLQSEVDSEKQKSKTILAKYQNLEDQLIESKNKGSQQEGELASQLRSKNQEVNALTAERSRLQSRIEGQEGKVAALEETVHAISEQLRLSKEGEARALSLHAQSVAVAERAKQDAKLHEQERRTTEKELEGAKERSGLLQRRLDKAENDLWTAQKERDQALQETKLEAEKITQNEIQIQQLRDWANQLRQLHSQSITTVKKILAAEEACESGYSCQSCLELMRDPVVLAPCGHGFCRTCYNSANASRKPPTDRAGDSRSYCPECKTHSVTCAVPSASLDLLSSKFAFRCNALRELQVVLEKSSAFSEKW